MAPSNDELLLTQALDLARAGIGLASPNPCVGALLVDGRGRIVGRGTHTYDGLKHAEILAVEEADPRARGGTLYLNLEPCCHQGRTPPCTQAVIAAGVGRVVACMSDPNPQVAGRGFAELRAAGITVSTGLLEAPARKLNEAFACYIRTQRPLVTLKAAMTLDGKIAARPAPANVRVIGAGAEQASTTYISGPETLQRVHEVRHAADAILVGVGTVIADDPLLTDRSGRPRRRRLLRVILDSRLRIPIDCRVVKTAQEDVLVLCSFAEENKRRELEQRGVRVEQVPLAAFEAGAEPGQHEGRPSLDAVLQRLGAMQITSLLVEGGSMVNWAFLKTGVVDKLLLFYSQRVFGPGAVPWLAGAEWTAIGGNIQAKNIEIHRIGDEFAVEGYLRDPYGG